MTTKKTQDEFYERLGERESSNNYSEDNIFRFVGKYQMGEAALKDIGYYNESTNPNYDKNDWRGKFTGKNGINSLEDFKKNKQVQEEAVREYHRLLWKRIKYKGLDQYVGKVINDTLVTPSGMIAAAHLKGVGFLENYLKKDGNLPAKDGLGTDMLEYLDFADYDFSDMTGPVLTPYTYKLYEKAAKKPNAYKYSDFFTLKKLQEINSSPTGYAAPIEDIFYATEDIKDMTNEEFGAAQDIINNQLKNKIAIPRIEANQGVQQGLYIYVKDYVRDDGVKVKGYYRRR